MDPNLYYLMVIGATLLYTTVYLYVTPTTVETNQTIYCHVSHLSVCVYVCMHTYLHAWLDGCDELMTI